MRTWIRVGAGDTRAHWYGGADAAEADDDADAADAWNDDFDGDETAQLSTVLPRADEAPDNRGWDGAEDMWRSSHRHLARMLCTLSGLAAALTLALVFVMQNSENIQIAYFQGRLRLPLGVAVLLGIVVGIMLVVIPGSARMLHLRLTARRRRAG